MFNLLKSCGQTLNRDIKWQASGGVCDGNFLAHAGLPTIDTLGGIGGKIHTHDEYLLTDSLVTQTQLVTLLLIKIAQNQTLFK